MDAPARPLPSPAGAIGPNPSWYNSAAFAAARPTSVPAQRRAADLFAARWGLLSTVPRRIVALYSPRIVFKLQPAAFQSFIDFWQVGGCAQLLALLKAAIACRHPQIIDRRIQLAGASCSTAIGPWLMVQQSESCSVLLCKRLQTLHTLASRRA